MLPSEMMVEEAFNGLDRLVDVGTQEEDTGFLSVHQLLAMTIDRQLLVEPFLQVVGVGAIVGAPDSGKSMFVRQLALSIGSRQTNFCGFPLNIEHGRAIIVATEDDQTAVKSPIERTMQAMGIEDADVRFLFADALTLDEIIARLDEGLSALPADLVVIDTYGDVFAGRDANNVTDARATIRRFSTLAAGHKCLILFVHHLRKNSYKEAPDQSHAQGSGGFVQKVRVCLDLRKDAANHDKKYLTVTKGNFISSSYKQDSFVLQFDEETFTFTNTGERIPKEQIGLQLPERSSAANTINWETIFYDKVENPILNRKTIVDRIKTQYGLQERSADNAIKQAVDVKLHKEGQGKYSLIRNGDVNGGFEF